MLKTGNTATSKWTSHRIDSSEQDYQQQLARYKKNDSDNPFVAGVQAYVQARGPGKTVQGTTTAYGDQPLKVQELIQPNFSQQSYAGNMASVKDTTGNLENQFSMTKNANRSPDELAAKSFENAIAARAKMYEEAQSNAYTKGTGNLNPRNMTMRLG